MAMTDFTIIRRSLLARFFSTVITTLMVAVAVGLMIVLLAMPDAGRDAFKRGSGNMHMLVSRDDSSLQTVLNGIFYASMPRRSIDWATYQSLPPRLRILEFAVPIQQGDSYRGFPVLATVPEFFSQFQPHLEEEWAFAEGGPFEKSFDVVLGSDVAAATGHGVGDEIVLSHGASESRGRTVQEDEADHAEDDHAHDDDEDDHAEDDHTDEDQDDEEHVEGPGHQHDEFAYTVVGILDRTGGPHDRALITDLESAWVIHAHDRRERELGHVETTTAADLTDADRQVTAVYLRVATREGSNVSSSQQMVFNQLRADPSLTVAEPNQEISKLFNIVANIDQIFFAMAAIVMFSSGIAILLALYNSMEQRRRQIAVLRVLGCSRGRVFGLVVTESAMLGMVGAITGVILAWFGFQAVSLVMNQKLGLVIDAALPIPMTAAVGLATIALASVAGMIPAFVAYRTPVVRNLRPLG